MYNNERREKGYRRINDGIQFPQSVPLSINIFQSTPRDRISKGGAAQIFRQAMMERRNLACRPFEARQSDGDIIHNSAPPDKGQRSFFHNSKRAGR